MSGLEYYGVGFEREIYLYQLKDFFTLINIVYVVR